MSYDFDANAYLDALKPPTFTVGDRTWRGRFLGVDSWFRLQERVEQLETGNLSVLEMRKLIRDLTGAIFDPPRAWWHRLIPWRPKYGEAVQAMDSLPLAAQMDALRTFIESQVTALRNPTRKEPPQDLATIQAGMGSPNAASGTSTG